MTWPVVQQVGAEVSSQSDAVRGREGIGRAVRASPASAARKQSPASGMKSDEPVPTRDVGGRDPRARLSAGG